MFIPAEGKKPILTLQPEIYKAPIQIYLVIYIRIYTPPHHHLIWFQLKHSICNFSSAKKIRETGQDSSATKGRSWDKQHFEQRKGQKQSQDLAVQGVMSPRWELFHWGVWTAAGARTQTELSHLGWVQREHFDLSPGKEKKIMRGMINSSWVFIKGKRIT